MFVGGKHDELAVAVTHVEQHVDQRFWISTKRLYEAPWGCRRWCQRVVRNRTDDLQGRGQGRWCHRCARDGGAVIFSRFAVSRARWEAASESNRRSRSLAARVVKAGALAP